MRINSGRTPSELRQEPKMSKNYIQISLPLILLLSLTQCTNREPSVKDIEGPPSMASSVEKAQQVSFCDLIRNPAQYNKAIVRTKALLHRNQENEFLDDPQCGVEAAGLVWVTFDSSYVYSDEKLKRQLIEMIRPKPGAPTGTARVTVVGRFDGPDGGPYGHLDGYRFRFAIIRLERVEETEPTIGASNLK